MWYARFLLFCFFLSATQASAQKRRQSDAGVVLRNLSGINTRESEFSPAFYGNGLVYVSRLKQGPVDETTNERYFDLFFSEISAFGQSLKPELFSIELNSPLHEGPAVFNRDLDKVYFTRSNQKNGISKQDDEGVVRLAIYEADRGFFDWENVQELPFNSPDFSCMHPALSPDGKKIFFASNKPGGYGGTDLYFAEKIGTSWSPAINLGPEINTPGNEAYPFYHDSGVLFFASNQHDSEGGLDIFSIDISTNTWGKVYSLGQPFNTDADDFGIILNEAGTKGYFSSNRSGGFGSDDIYSFESPDPVNGLGKPSIRQTRLLARNEITGTALEGVNIWVFEADASGKIKDRSNYDFQIVNHGSETSKWKLDLVRKSLQELGPPTMVSDASGSSMYGFSDALHYIVIVFKPGYELLEVPLSISKNLYSDPLLLNMRETTCIPLHASVLVEGSKQAIAGAEVILVNEQKGEEKVLETNAYGFFDDCLDQGTNYLIRIRKEGYREIAQQLNTASGTEVEPLALQFYMQALDGTGDKQSISEGSVIILEAIYYDFNQSAIRSGEVEELEALAGLMFQYPGMQIELASHTDTRGTAAYNLQLSEKRANSTKRYLVNKGIAAHRIKTVGYGEAYPRNHCLDGIPCSEEEHAYNRRTEIRILSLGN